MPRRATLRAIEPNTDSNRHAGGSAKPGNAENLRRATDSTTLAPRCLSIFDSVEGVRRETWHRRQSPIPLTPVEGRLWFRCEAEQRELSTQRRCKRRSP